MYDPIADSEGMPAEARVRWVVAATKDMWRAEATRNAWKEWITLPSTQRFMVTYARYVAAIYNPDR